jgi:hypothetical protein
MTGAVASVLASAKDPAIKFWMTSIQNLSG